MSILISAILVVLVIALLVWAVGYLSIPEPPRNIIIVAIILVGALIILRMAGLL